LETLKYFLQLFIDLRKDWGDTNITELLDFRSKSILAGDLNAKHPALNSKFSNPSYLTPLELFVSFNFGISAQQFSAHYTPNSRGDFLDTVVYQNIRLTEVIVTDTLDLDHLPKIRLFTILDSARKKEALDLGALSKPRLCTHTPYTQIHSSNEADKRACNFAASIVSAYSLSTRKTTPFDS
jgi:hypothetical protein